VGQSLAGERNRINKESTGSTAREPSAQLQLATWNGLPKKHRLSKTQNSARKQSRR
jgi:hypothetical protein